MKRSNKIEKTIRTEIYKRSYNLWLGKDIDYVLFDKSLRSCPVDGYKCGVFSKTYDRYIN